MLYFFILPAFLLWLVVAAGSVVLAKSVKDLQPALPYVWRICLHATLGFLIANIMFIVALWIGSDAMKEATSEPKGGGLLQAMIGVAVILGPVVASAIGWFCGAVTGFLFAFRSRQHA